MKIFTITLFSFLFSGSIIAQSENLSLMHDGIARDFKVYVPDAITTNTKPPLVFNFHGFGSNAGQEELYTLMNDVADDHGFIVVYPEGVNAAWNVGWSFGSQADDVGFTEAMIDYMAQNYNIDQTRTYACGMSNGGFFSYTLACQIPEKIAAIASVTGSMVPNQIGSCKPDFPTPILQIHGTNDPTVPYDGAPLISEPIEDLIDFWRDINGCNASDISTTDLPDSNTNDGSTAQVIDYNSCEAPGALKFIKIENGEHTWPGAAINIGITNRDINGSKEIWLFFSNYSRPSAVSTQDFPLETLAIYPNPSTQSEFILSNAADFDHLEIIDQHGQLISRQDIFNENINLPSLAKGIYIMKSFKN